MIKWAAALVCVILLSQCNKKTYTLDNRPSKYIEIGSYGGFTGAAETLYIFQNGQVFSEESFQDPKELKKINPKEFKAMCKQLISTEFDKLKLNNPGNMNSYIRLKTKKTDHKVLWSNSKDVSKEIMEFYSSTFKKIKESNSSNEKH